MAREFNRTDRIGQLMQRELAQMIQHDIGDPRVGLVTISHVDVTADLKYAKIYVTRLTGQETQKNIDECLAGLSHAAGFLRRNLAKRIDLRIMPELKFLYDKSLEHGFHMDALIAKANSDSDGET